MKLKNIPTIILLFAINELLLCQSYDQNYITTRTMLNATGTSAIETVRYFDGLGRLVETVAKGITPDGQDLVSYQTYDACGRDDKAYLPRKAAQNSGNYMEFSTFNALPKNIYQYDEKPYAQTVYEPSPLNRVVEQYGAGADWYAHSKSIKTAYLSNNGSNSCAYYYVSGDNLVKNGNYASNQLYVTQIVDEDGNTTLEFKDKQGKIVLTRRCSDWADTYYVYDDEDNLRFVLSPEAADQLTANTTFNAETNTALKTLAYIYRYDYRKRCVYKRLPGCDPIYYVYDKSDRLIFSQDGEQRLKALWQFFIPDIFGRTVLTGYCQKLNNTAPAVGLYDQQLITASAFSASGAYKGYNILIDGAAKTLTTYTLTTAYYFDNYNFMGTFDIPNTAEMQYETGYAIQHSSAQGLLTGSWVAQGNNSAGRLIDLKHRLNSGAEITLAHNEYDDLGRLQATTANNQTALRQTYNYNVRSWLTGINGNLFSEQLFYNAPRTNAAARYNGNIAATISNDYFGVDYTYDEQNRLQFATYFIDFGEDDDPFYEDEFFTMYLYDKNSNMWMFRRKEYQAWEEFFPIYNGNQLKNIFYTTDDDYYEYYDGSYSAFVDYGHGNGLTADYTYNRNGAMTTDPAKGATFLYNNIGQFVRVVVPSVNGTIKYNYSATGEKLQATYTWHSGLSLDPMENTGSSYSGTNSTLTRYYVGNKIYENGALKMILLPNGYIKNGAYYFYLRDHLGNNTVVANANGTVQQRNYYFPYGKPIEAESFGESVQPYRFGGKEEDRMLGANLMDFEARALDYYGRFMQVDPHCESYYSWSPYAAMACNPVRYIDPTGMEIEEGSLKEWEKLKQQVEKQRDKLQSDINKLNAKAEAKGWSSEKLAGKIGNRAERLSSLNSSLGTMGTLEGSSQVYGLSHTGYGENGGVTLNASTNVIDIKFGSTANFVHEMTHAGQFETGDIAFSNTGIGLGQDVFDEVAAYKAQFGYSPSSVSGLTSTSVANSFGSITPAWVQGIKDATGNMPYAAGGSANTGLIPINVNSTRDALIQAYPWNAAVFRGLPATFTLKSLPGIYYKR